MRFNFGYIDIIDIFIGAILLYQLYKLLKGTQGYRVFVGVLIVMVLWIIISSVLQMRLMGAVLNQVMSVGVIALIVIFQDELRQFLNRFGSGRNFISKLFASKEQTMEAAEIMQIVLACKNLSREKVGALIVIERNMNLQSIAITGDEIDAKINARLIENIFFKNSPLHDGAMIISERRIKAAGCILPVSHNLNVPKSYGLRHRAALGVTEKLDVKAIIVSEETGKMSFSQNGMLKFDVSTKDLEMLLSEAGNL